MPLFDIPQPPPYSLTDAPLAQALAQVRYPLIAEFETMAGIVPLQRELREYFPYMEQQQVQEVSFVVGPAGPAAAGAAQSVTWNLTDDSGNLLVVGSGSATLSVGDTYSNVSDFADLFSRLLTALSTVKVPKCDRLGVRYLSIVHDLPGEGRAWRNWFNPDLLGWSGSAVVGDGCSISSMSQVQLTHPPTEGFSGLPSNIQAVVRHGAVPAGSAVPGIPPIQVDASSYLLDMDLSVEGRQPVHPSNLLDQFHILHAEIDRFFYWSLTREGGKHFGLKHRED